MMFRRYSCVTPIAARPSRPALVREERRSLTLRIDTLEARVAPVRYCF